MLLLSDCDLAMLLLLRGVFERELKTNLSERDPIKLP